MTGIELIAIERKRQIDVEGYSIESDSKNTNENLALAGSVYAMPAEYRKINNSFVGTPNLWPWDGQYWKPTSEDRVRELVKAGALIAAEIDRINVDSK